MVSAVALAAIASLYDVIDQVGPVERKYSCGCSAVVSEAAEIEVDSVMFGL